MARILVCDDDLAVNVVLGKALTRQGHDVRTTFAGDEAIARCVEGGYDLLILDLTLPRVDGFAVLQRLQSFNVLDRMPVLIVTARQDREARQKALELGASDFLVKPFELDELSLRVRRCLERGPRRRLPGAPPSADFTPPPFAVSAPPAPLAFSSPGLQAAPAPGPAPLRVAPPALPPAAPQTSPSPVAAPPSELAGRRPAPPDATVPIVRWSALSSTEPDRPDCVGVIERLRALHLVRFFHLLKLTGWIKLRKDHLEGEIRVRDGELVKVELTSGGSPALDSVPALRALFGWESGQFRLRLGDVEDPPAIAHPTATLLKELAAAR